MGGGREKLLSLCVFTHIHLCNRCFLCLLQIIASNPEEQKMFGRHFDMEDELVSHISRKSIDILKTNYRVSVLSHFSNHQS